MKTTEDSAGMAPTHLTLLKVPSLIEHIKYEAIYKLPANAFCILYLYMLQWPKSGATTITVGPTRVPKTESQSDTL